MIREQKNQASGKKENFVCANTHISAPYFSRLEGIATILSEPAAPFALRIFCVRLTARSPFAALAQLVEQLICN
jgi:hypothetical protein